MSNKSVQTISHDSCTGCMMCGDICAKHAITFKIDKGFWFPEVDSNLCVNCNMCVKRCPALNDAPKVCGPIACYGAKSKDENTRWNSTSGGFFTELAKAIISDGGYCAGAIYGENNEIVHSIENSFAGIEKLRQSKYAQSNTLGVYRKVKELLKFEKKVLFCGTACQVEALKAYLGKDFENLFTMDFICLGVCSPVVYRKYLSLMEKRYKSKVTKVWFKNKSDGWRSIGTKLEFANGKSYFRVGNRDLFMVSFVGDSIAMRKNCEFCKYRKIPHNSDFTVADFWGIENVNPTMDDNKGLSAVFANTAKGNKMFKRISDSLDYFETTSDNITKGNFSALLSKAPGRNRDAFLSSLETMPLDKAIEKYGEEYSGSNRRRVDYYYYKNRIIQLIKSLLR